MNRLARLGVLGASIVSAGILTVGMGIASADTIFNTGPGSHNVILTKSTFNQTVRNMNQVNISNRNFQTAVTGTAFVTGNTNVNNCAHLRRNKLAFVSPHKMHNLMANRPISNQHRSFGGVANNTSHQGGGAITGNASNFNATEANVNITNVAPTSLSSNSDATGSSTISNTGPHSFNLISSSSSSNVETTNTNNVDIMSTNNQTAVSGNATVSGNTRGGSATTGDATNTNSTDIEVAIANE